MKDYYELTKSGQFRRNRSVAVAALEQFGVTPTSLRPLVHAENTTFHVTAKDASEYCIRIHRPGYHRVEDIRSELRFLEVVRSRLDLIVPEPIHSLEGDLLVQVESAGVPEQRTCALFRWIDGRFFKRKIPSSLVYEVGRATAQLHQLALELKPADYSRHVWAEPEKFAELAECVVKDERSFLVGKKDVFIKAAEEVAEAMWAIGRPEDAYGLIHSDLHQGNYLLSNGKLALIDFDDLGWCHFNYDAATTLFTFLRSADFEEMARAYVRGYSEVRVPPFAVEGLEVWFTARMLLMLLWFFNRTDNPGLQDMLPTLVERWHIMLSNYLDEGKLRMPLSKPA